MYMHVHYMIWISSTMHAWLFVHCVYRSRSWRSRGSYGQYQTCVTIITDQRNCPWHVYTCMHACMHVSLSIVGSMWRHSARHLIAMKECAYRIWWTIICVELSVECQCALGPRAHAIIIDQLESSHQLYAVPYIRVGLVKVHCPTRL